MTKGFIIFISSLFLLVTALPDDSFGGNRKRKNKDKTEEATRESKYDKLFKQEKFVTRKGVFTLHKTDKKLYFEIPLTLLNREFLLGSTIKETSDNGYSLVGQKPQEPLHLAFARRDSSIQLLQITQPWGVIPKYSDSREDELKQSIRKSSISPIIKTYEIKAFNNDSTAVVIDMTDLFLSDDERVSPFDPYGIKAEYGRVKLSPEYQQELSFIDDIKAFEDNVSIISSLNYTIASQENKEVKLPVTIKVNRSIILLPDEEHMMRSRISDPRIGFFTTVKQNISVKRDGSKYVYFMNRWNVQPKDMEAYKRGELVEPVKPIVFYIDNTFPAEWKKAIHAGVLEWNVAFEKIGFKNVMQAKDFPMDDPEFDPDNLKYSCIRYAPIDVANGMGPSWTDPRTGEIINASVYIYHDVIKLVNDMRFVQTAQVNERVRTKKLPQDILDESLNYVIAHEVGHCLGLMHNMGASSSYPVDSLRSASFTQKYGTTPSIMDYARNNYIAQPGDKGLRLTPPNIGVYDFYAIKIGYQPIPEAKTAEEENAIVRGWIAEKAGDPMFRYGKQQLQAVYDPSALMEDLGDDAVKAGEYGIKNLKYILEHVNEWMDKEDPNFDYRINIYGEIVNQCFGYLYNALMNIGGFYLNEHEVNDPRPSFAVVPKEKQKQSLRFLIKNLQQLEWLDNPQVTENLRVSSPRSERLVKNFAAALLVNTKKISLGEYRDPNSYSSQEYLNDLHALVWEPTIKGKNLSAIDMLLQKTILSSLLNSLLPVNWTVKRPPIAEKPMLRRTCSCGEHMASGFEFQYPVYNIAHDNTKYLYFSLLDRIEKTVKSKRATGNFNTRAHHAYLLEMIEDFRNRKE